MRGGKRAGAGRKQKPDHLRREVIAIRLPGWMIERLKKHGASSYLIESLLLKHEDFKPPADYDIDE